MKVLLFFSLLLLACTAVHAQGAAPKSESGVISIDVPTSPGIIDDQTIKNMNLNFDDPALNPKDQEKESSKLNQESTQEPAKKRTPGVKPRQRSDKNKKTS